MKKIILIAHVLLFACAAQGVGFGCNWQKVGQPATRHGGQGQNWISHDSTSVVLDDCRDQAIRALGTNDQIVVWLEQNDRGFERGEILIKGVQTPFGSSCYRAQNCAILNALLSKQVINPCSEIEINAELAIAQMNQSLNDTKKKLADLQAALKKQVDDARDKSNKQVAAAQDGFKAELVKAQKAAADAVTQREKDLDAKIAAAQQAYAEPLKKVQSELQGTLQKIQQSNLQALQQKNQQRAQEVKAAIDKLQQLQLFSASAMKIIPQATGPKDPRLQQIMGQVQAALKGMG